MQDICFNIYPISSLKDNYIWLIKSKDTNECWIVDPGEALPVLRILKQDSLKLSGILVTHHHKDHCAGIPEILNVLGKIPIYGSYNSLCPYITIRVKEGDIISLISTKITILEIPGHTLDHIAYLNNDLIFCGDTIFSAGCGKIFEGTSKIMYESITKIANLNDNIQIYCAHEYTLNNLKFSLHVDPSNSYAQRKLKEVELLISKQKCTLPSSLGDEKKYNPFLRCKEANIISSTSRYAAMAINSPLEVFRHLREWKNNYSI
ncbi:MAG TPA: hydroxyacylglutathione hydrolase [Gammaproteobacteria bacterium]|nr:hydroxyacylglutathione hydrolase [Gammaproteobacteria bacterium]